MFANDVKALSFVFHRQTIVFTRGAKVGGVGLGGLQPPMIQGVINPPPLILRDIF